MVVTGSDPSVVLECSFLPAPGSTRVLSVTSPASPGWASAGHIFRTLSLVPCLSPT